MSHRNPPREGGQGSRALAAALRYAELYGLRIVPLCWPAADSTRESPKCARHRACGKSAGKAPLASRWQDCATADADPICGWFQKWPDANVGVALGRGSGVVALDVDGPGGELLLEELFGELPPTWEVKTGNGRRLLFRIPESLEFDPGQRVLKAAEGGELRLQSTGGQCVLPPSLHYSGLAYEWAPGRAPGECECASMLPALVQFSAPAPKPDDPLPTRTRDDYGPTSADLVARRVLPYLAKLPASISGQGGHSALFMAARALVTGFGLPEAVALAALREHFNPRCVPPWSERELEHKVRQALNTPFGKPPGYLLNVEHAANATPRGEPEFRREVFGRSGHFRASRPGDEGGGPNGGAGDPPPGDERGTEQGAAVDPRPVVVVDAEEHRVNAEALAALAGDLMLYARAGSLVEVRGNGGDLELVELPTPVVRHYLSRSVRFVRVTKGGELAPAHPPDWAVNYAARAGAYPGFRPLAGAVGFPVLLPAGRVLAGGYDPETQLYVAAGAIELAVPAAPTRDDARSAAGRLLDLVGEFPFKSAAHQSAWLAALLTALARPAFVGPAPLTLIDANAPGVGKTLLAQLLHVVLTGRGFAVTPYPGDGDELRKCVTAFALCGTRLVLFDNLAGRVGGPVLDAALTAGSWAGRPLGQNEARDYPLQATFVASGNNVRVYGDAARRTLHVRLELDCERPDARGGWRHGDLLAHARAHRAALLSDCFTILTAWPAAGRPPQGLRPWGSYEAWSGVVREAVVYAGLPDPDLTRDELREGSDRDGDVMGAVLEGLAELDPRAAGVTAAAMAAGATGEFRAALEELCGPKPLTGGSIGYALRGFEGRTFGGLRLVTQGKSRGSALWAARPATAPSTQVSESNEPAASASAPGAWRYESNDRQGATE